MSEDSSDDEEYEGFGDNHHNHITSFTRRYPLHDCCEFEGIDALRKLILIPVEEEQEKEGSGHETEDDSSSDDNDSTAAAHAAAIGHSPQPLKAVKVLEGSDDEEDGDDEAKDTQGKVEKKEESGESVGKETATAEEQPDIPVHYTNDVVMKDKESVETDGERKENIEVSAEASKVEEKVDNTVNEVVPMEASADESKVDSSAPMEETSEKSLNGKDSEAMSTEAKKTSPKPRKYRLNRAINLNERDDDENTALHIAIHSRKLEHVKLLLELGASFRIRCDGSWPLHTALSMGALREHRQFAYECFVVLHEYGADLTTKDESLHTPLFLACTYNLPQIANYILSDDDGLSTLNARADRAGNRPLHAAAKFDTPDNPSFSKIAAASATGQVRSVPHHHPDGSVVNAVHSIPRFPGKLENSLLTTNHSVPTVDPDEVSAPTPSTEALLTQELLATTGIEVDALNAMAQTPLHVACARGNWPVVRLLLQAGANPALADRRGYTPGQLAYKRGMPIPNDLMDTLGDPPETGINPPPRDLVVDPHGSTMLLCHELCMLHRTCPPMRRGSAEPPPENIARLRVLVDPDTGILKSGEFGTVAWVGHARRAAMGDVLKIHEYNYVERISQLASAIPDHPSAIANLDPDTAISHWSFEAAMRAAGSVCEAVDRVVAGDHRNAFCAVRPPGHHAGPRGIVKCPNDPEGGSHGFCLLNNVCIGAAYARCMYRNEGIKKVAIIDFDVHHGNGTEEVIRNLVPTTEKASIRVPFASGELVNSTYRPWLDETDIHNVFFSSTHGYGRRGYDQPGWFYPASGKTHVSEAITHPAMVESPNTADFILSQTWTRMGEESKANCCKIINIGLDLPDPDCTDPQSRSMKQRIELRDSYRRKILPYLRDFDPDLIFISAGFDAHRKDTMNFGYVGMVEDDYEWVTEQIIKVANTCCNGRVISVLEGGYKIHGGIVSPFARSVASHVRAMVDGGRSRELYDAEEGEWESQYERSLFEKRERKKEQEREQLRLIEEANRKNIAEQWASGGVPDDPDAPSRKRRRRVDYKELFRQMQQEGFAG